MAIVVQNATRDDMRVLETTLGTAAQDIIDTGIGAPSIVCIGRVVLMRQCLDWLGQMAGEPVRDDDPLGVGLSRTPDNGVTRARHRRADIGKRENDGDARPASRARGQG